MLTSSFQFELFPSNIYKILSDCTYITLPFEIPNIYVEVNCLLTKCAETFFRENIGLDDLNQCMSYSKNVLDISWEKINTGHWKNVDPNWRQVYTLASLFKVLCLLAKKDGNTQEIIKICDMGILMGIPVMKNILTRIASHLSNLNSSEDQHETEAKKIKIDHPTRNYPIIHPVKEEINLQVEKFMTIYKRNSCPVVLTGLISHWPALSSRQWNVEYILKKCYYRTVPIEIGSKYTEDSWTQKLMIMKDFVTKYIWDKSNGIGYLAQYNLFDQVPELFEDISIPAFISSEKNVDISVYFGPAGTISPLHFDPKDNLLVQVFGEKYIRLYSKDETKCLYPRENTWLSNTSQVDIDNPDLESFPLFSKATYSECVLKPGSLLYIPPGCWHYVRSLSTSFSISFWW